MQKDGEEIEPEVGGEAEPDLGDLPGVWREFNELGQNTIVTEGAVAAILGKHLMSIRRAIDKQQLPPPVKLMDQRVWRLGAILDFIDGRLAAEQKDAEKLRRKVLEMAP